MWSQTTACIAKLLRDLLDITQHGEVIPYQHFGTTYQPSFKVQEIPKKEHSMTEVSWHSLLFLDTVHHLITFRFTMFREAGLFLLSGKEAPNPVDTLDWIIVNNWAPQKQ